MTLFRRLKRLREYRPGDRARSNGVGVPRRLVDDGGVYVPAGFPVTTDEERIRIATPRTDEQVAATVRPGTLDGDGDMLTIAMLCDGDWRKKNLGVGAAELVPWPDRGGSV